MKSHPSWVCGLKLPWWFITDEHHRSHPSWVCGLKLPNALELAQKQVSHPSWVCGLKLGAGVALPRYRSHTLRGCVDWNKGNGTISLVSIVTPFVGVWIETENDFILINTANGHTLRGCVDWNWLYRTVPDMEPPSHPSWVCGLKRFRRMLTEMGICHTLHGCVDWNFNDVQSRVLQLSHTLHGCVDWNLIWWAIPIISCVTPFVGVWIETDLEILNFDETKVTLFVGVWI